jgi:FkbM family methyltransferase
MELNFPPNFLRFLAEFNNHHSHDSGFYQVLENLSKRVLELTSETDPLYVSMAELGVIQFPYEKMGSVDSLASFGLDELLLYSYYFTNKHRYKKVLDIGANLGLHSIFMSRCFSEVLSYEPDPIHVKKLERNLQLNNIKNCKVIAAAVSDKFGEMSFIRVLGNTTSSHLMGAKENPYGDLELLQVPTVDISCLLEDVDFAKIDAEGHEAVIINAIPKQNWNRLEAFVEIGSPENAKAIFDNLSMINVNIFSQKINWQRVTKLTELPTSYKEGSVFLTQHDSMAW